MGFGINRDSLIPRLCLLFLLGSEDLKLSADFQLSVIIVSESKTGVFIKLFKITLISAAVKLEPSISHTEIVWMLVM